MASLKDTIIAVIGDKRFQGLIIGFAICSLFALYLSGMTVSKVDAFGISFINIIDEIDIKNKEVFALKSEVDKHKTKIIKLENLVEERTTEAYRLNLRLASVETRLDMLSTATKVRTNSL
jgi:hypothetical protein